MRTSRRTRIFHGCGSIGQCDRRLIERLSIFIKYYRSGQNILISSLRFQSQNISIFHISKSSPESLHQTGFLSGFQIQGNASLLNGDRSGIITCRVIGATCHTYRYRCLTCAMNRCPAVCINRQYIRRVACLGHRSVSNNGNSSQWKIRIAICFRSRPLCIIDRDRRCCFFDRCGCTGRNVDLVVIRIGCCSATARCCSCYHSLRSIDHNLFIGSDICILKSGC